MAGLLDLTPGGPSDEPDGGSRRRSLYLTQRRHRPPATQALFDAPPAAESCPQRHVSTVPLQPLHLLNGAEALRHAEAFAARVVDRAGSDPDLRIDSAFLLTLGRHADETERTAAREFFARQSDGGASAAMVRFCQALLNLNEFVYLE